MDRIKIDYIYKDITVYSDKEVMVCGFIRNLRDSKNIAFIELNDGSNFNSIQIVLDSTISNYNDIISLNIGSSIEVIGVIKLTPNTKQPFELVAKNIVISGKSTPDYPLQNKRHSMEFLRENAHLRVRTNTFSAVFRVRSVLANEIHNYFNNLGYVYINTPIITSSDGEGAGEMFKITTDDKKNFFSKDAYLTVTGQLMAECMMMGLSSVYTFGPTFRAENSNTTRHAAEFWMMEPEIAFADLVECMNIQEDMIRTVIKNTMIRCKDEINFFNEFMDKNLINKLNNVINNTFEKVTYTDAIDILKKNNDNFEYKVSWGDDIATEHERYIAEVIYKKPVFITNYPKDIKAFYMKQNDDNKTVAAADLVVPGIGEIIGGSQREEDYDKLVSRMKELNMDIDSYDWYLDIRKYGTCVHSGFGLGFERLVMYVTGITNIRDTIPFPRTVGSLKY